MKPSVKRTWDIEELIEHFTLVPSDEELLGNKTGATRLGFAVLLKCFQLYGRFPAGRHEIPKAVIDYIARQLKLDPAVFAAYDWQGRSITLHRSQIREQYHFRDATDADAKELTSWLVASGLALEANPERLKASVYAECRERHLLPPTPERIDRLIHSACSTAEQSFFAETMDRLSNTSKARLDALLERSLEAEATHEDAEMTLDEDAEAENLPDGGVSIHVLKLNPGPVGVKSMQKEVAKLRTLEHLLLPADLLSVVPSKVVARYRNRAAAETLHELRRHPDATRYTLLAAFC